MLARPLFDPDVGLEECLPTLEHERELLPAEAALVAGAVEKRRAEFATGRFLARRLLRGRGIEGFALVNDADRAPVWPSGFVGSISHTKGYCGVVLASSARYRGLGLDVEQAAPLSAPVLRSVTRPEERAALELHGAEEAQRLGKLVFSAKEAAYKAQYAVSGKYLGFSAMTIELDLEHHRFEAVFAEPVGGAFARGDRLPGRFAYVDALVLTAVALPVREVAS